MEKTGLPIKEIMAPVAVPSHIVPRARLATFLHVPAVRTTTERCQSGGIAAEVQ